MAPRASIVGRLVTLADLSRAESRRAQAAGDRDAAARANGSWQAYRNAAAMVADVIEHGGRGPGEDA